MSGPGPDLSMTAYKFEYSEKDLSIIHSSKTEFEILIEKKWIQAMDAGSFRYTLTDLDSKILPGSRNLIVQLNRSRFETRRKPQPIQSLIEPFDSSKFNFTKVREDEILFEMQGEGSISSCLINVSPLDFCHSLIVPKPNDHQNQILNNDAIRVALHCLLLTWNPSIRVAYNSLRAHASVNHLHLHVWILNHDLFVQVMRGRHLHGNCYEMIEHEVGGFAWEIDCSASLPAIAEQVSAVIGIFIQRGVAHNLFVTRGNRFSDSSTGDNLRVVRLLLWPRKSVTEMKCENNYNIAVAELAGQIPVRTEETFESVTEKEITDAYKEIRLHNELYEALVDDVVNELKKWS